MAKSSLTLPTGAVVTLEGTAEEVSQLLAVYARSELPGAPGRPPEQLRSGSMAAPLPGKSLLAIYALLVGLLLMVTVGVGYLNLRSVGGVREAMQFEVVLPYSYLAQAQIRLANLLSHTSVFAYVPETRAASQAASAEDRAEIERQIELYRATISTADEQAQLMQFDQVWGNYQSLVGSLVAEAAGGNEPALAQILAESLTAGQAAQEALARASELKLRQAEALNQRGESQMQAAATTLAMLGAVDVLMVALLTVFLIRRGQP